MLHLNIAARHHHLANYVDFAIIQFLWEGVATVRTSCTEYAVVEKK
jgi:hypothetical protein